MFAEAGEHAGGALDRRAFGHVDDDLELRLVVEGQHLQHDQLHDREQHGDDDRAGGRPDRAGGGAAARDRRSRNGVISARKAVQFACPRVPRRSRSCALRSPKQLAAQPRRENQRDRERDQHAHAGVDRDRAHVRAHQAGDERHRQQRRDDGEGREDRRPADLVDGARDELGERPLVESARCRWTFSTITIASSTRMPIEKISANSDTRLIVKPQAQEANNVAASVTMTAAPTTTASRLPTVRRTSRTTEASRTGASRSASSPCRSRSRRSCA